MKISDFARYTLSLFAGVALLVACSSLRFPLAVPAASGTAGRAIPKWQATHAAHPACPKPGIGEAQCLVLIQDKGLKPACVGESCGWGPVDFQTRYNLPSATKGSDQIVAIVDAYDEPNASSDLSTYRGQFGLGTANLIKYNQNGQTSNYPQSCTVFSGWCVEEDLDIEMVSAVCPKCTIYLIEANGADASDLEKAEAEAVTLGAHIVSNSWICYGSLDCGDPEFSRYFDTSGVEYLAASGDSGYSQIGAPMVLGSVVSVGGTVLMKSGSMYSEIAWDGDGSGCATGVTKPTWQHDPGCGYRTDNDVSAVASGVAEYDSSDGGWFTVAGTSIASPLIAGVYGLAGNADKQDAAKKLWAQKERKYRHDLHDIIGGSDGGCGNYLCEAGPGYDGPTGWGTPKGIGAF